MRVGRILVHCDGVNSLSGASRSSGDRLHTITTKGLSAKHTLRVQPLSDALRGSVSPIALDLVRIAAYVYWADQQQSRGGRADVAGDSWQREFVLGVPVSNPDIWNSTGVVEALSEVLSFASEDVWDFRFEYGVFDTQLYLDSDVAGPRNDPDSVVLFSGGADSLCAAVKTVVEDGRKPLLVSHHATSYVDHRQRALVEALRTHVPAWWYPHSGLLVNKAGVRERDITQRTRSFLFASLGTGIASALGVTDVMLPDNGVVSLNLPFNDQLLGALASRSTHPKFIRGFNRLARQLFPNGPQLNNPLWNRTRTEVLDTLKQNGVPHLLQLTNSCSHTRGLPNVTPHCGTCSQCIDRACASIAAGLGEHDLREQYRTDPFRDDLAGDGLTTATSYVSFARSVAKLPEEALFDRYPQLDDCILPDDPAPGETAQQLTAMLKRQAEAVMRAVQIEAERASRELVHHTLPRNCLIQLAIDRSDANARPAQLPSVRLTAAEESEFRRHRFSGRCVLRINGDIEPRSSNVISLDQQEIMLPDAQFRLLLRLVVALFEADDGYFRPQPGGHEPFDLDDVITEPSRDRELARLRARLRPALGDVPVKSYVQVNRGRTRLSTHRRFVLVDVDRLKQHPDLTVRRLAARLPAATTKRQRKAIV